MSKPVFEDFGKFTGRRNRLSFLIAYAVAVAMVMFMIFMMPVLFHLNPKMFESVNGVLVIIIIFYALYASSSLISQRLEDLNRSKWELLLLLIPGINLLIIIPVIFAKGTQGENKYGPDPLGPK